MVMIFFDPAPIFLFPWLFFLIYPIICTDPEEFQKMQKNVEKLQKKASVVPYPSRLNCWIFPFFFFVF